jgi:regulatory protein
LLGVRWRSREELRTRLLRAGFDSDQVTEALAGLEAAGLIDDERFAAELVRSQAGRLSGARAIRHALRLRGVAPDVAEAALVQAGDEFDKAVELARRRASRMRGLPPDVAARRLSGLLLRRGYGYDLAASAVRAALTDQVPGSDSPEPED